MRGLCHFQDLGVKDGDWDADLRQATPPQNPHPLGEQMGVLTKVSTPHRACVNCCAFLILRLNVGWVPEPALRCRQDAKHGWPHLSFFPPFWLVKNGPNRFMSAHVCGDHEDLMTLLNVG